MYNAIIKTVKDGFVKEGSLKEVTPDKKKVLKSLEESINQALWIVTELFPRRQTCRLTHPP